LFYSKINKASLLDIFQFKKVLLKNYPEFEGFYHDPGIKEHVCLAGGFPGKILTNNWNSSNSIQYYQNQRARNQTIHDITISENDLRLYLDESSCDFESYSIHNLNSHISNIDFYLFDINNSNDAEKMVLNIYAILLIIGKNNKRSMKENLIICLNMRCLSFVIKM
jgi:hypothetical protein